MARKVINIGTTGNDATGDSIRGAFSKVNQNFTEIYASLGLSGGLKFVNLDDTPSTITANQILTTNTAGDAVASRTLEGVGIAVDFSSDPTKLTLRTTGTEIRLDTTPELGGDLNAQTFLIENLGTPVKPQDAVTKQYADNTFLDVAGDTATGVLRLQNGGSPRVPNDPDEAVNKSYADTKVRIAGETMTGPLILSETPSFADSGLQAATKAYVDNNSFTSKENLFVSTNGRTEAQMVAAGVDQTQVGRSLAYSFNSIQEAAFYAERIVKGDIVLRDQGLLGNNVEYTVLGSGLTSDTFQVQLGTHTDVHTYNSGGIIIKGDDTFFITNAPWNNVTGVLTVTVDRAHNLTAGDKVEIRNIRYTCSSGAEIYPKVDIIFKVPGKKPGPYTVNLAADGTEDTTNVLANKLFVENRSFVQHETIAFINAEIADGDNTDDFATTFRYQEDKCFRDIGLIIDAVSFDLTYGGNSKTVDAAASYWNGATSRVAGQQNETVAAINFAKSLILTNILTNTAYTGSLQTTVSQFIDTTIIPETGAAARITTLMDIVTNVISNGLGVLPAKTGGEGREQNIPDKEVTIHVESGLYEEYLGITLPENVSLKGDEFRRVIIQAKVGVRPTQRNIIQTFERGDLKRFDGTGTPKAARFRNHFDSQYSRADTVGGVNQTGAAQIRLKDLVYYPKYGQYFTFNGVTYYVKEVSFDPAGQEDFTRADLSLYSDINLTTATTLQHDIPNNTVIELKLLNQHLDFFLVNNACILRNITMRRHQGFCMVLDHEGQILTKSPYVQTCSSFSGQGGGGQLVDGNAGVQYGTVVDNPATGTSITLSGLTREVQLPTTFLYQGSGAIEKKTYRIIGATAPVDDGLGNTPTTFKQTLTLSSTTSIVTDTNALPNGNIPQGEEIRVETAGNKSMTSNDYTQINSDGYGLVATNNGLIETVSVFTYYCDTAYWARNGGQIRSLNGSNGYGRIALKAEGSDPNENIQAGQVFFRELNALVESDSSRRDFSQDITIHNPTGQEANTGATDLEIRDFDYRPIENSKFKLTQYSSNNDSTNYEVDELEDVTVNITGISIAAEAVVTTNTNHYYREGAMVFIAGADANGMTGVDGIYYVKLVDATSFKLATNVGLTAFLDTTAKGNPSYSGSGANAKGGGRAKLKLGSALAVGVGTVIADGSRFTITIGKKITVRNLKDTPRVLPSSALIFATGDQSVFRILGVERLVTNEVGDPSVDYQLMSLDLQFPADRFNGDIVKVTTKISTLRATGHDFLNIGWGNFIDSNYPNNVFGNPTGRPDFAADQASEAVEVGAGRVFYASTDQDGNFRVGKFFRVNQGDGSVELNANISLTNVDGLGFTKGTVINEFSTDDKMLGKSDDAVPTEASAVTYLNSAVIGQHEDGTTFPEWTTTGSQAGGNFGLLSRAGYNASNLTWNRMYGELNMGTNLITNISMSGAGDDDGVNKLYADNVFRGSTTDSLRTDVKAFTMLNDSSDDTGSIDMNGNRIKSLRDPFDGTDAVNKQYVDEQNRIGGLEGVTVTGNPNDTDLLMFSGTNHTDGLGNAIQGAVNVALDTTTDTTGGSPTFGEPTGTGSDVRITRLNNQINIQLANGAVKNTDVSAAAAIDQSKLNLNAATVRANATGITPADLGVAAFHSTEFADTNGWIELKAPSISNPNDGVTLSKMEFITGNSILGNNQSSENAVVALTASQTRALIDFDNSVEAYITENVLDTNGALVKSGGTMIGTLQTQNVRPSSDDTFDLGQASARYNEGFIKNIVTDNISPRLGVTLQITNVTQADPAVVSFTVLGGTNNLTNGDQVRIDGLASMSQLNGTVGYISGLTASSFEFYVDSGLTNGVDTTAFTAHSGTNDGNVYSRLELMTVKGITNQPLITADSQGGGGDGSRFHGSADRWTTARTLTLSGDLSGSVSWSGDANATLSANVLVSSGNTSVNNTFLRRNGIADDSFMQGVFGSRNIVPTDGTDGQGTNVINDATYDIGASNNRYNNIHAVRFEGTASAAEFADLAEKYLADESYEPGTVVVFGGEQEVTANVMMKDPRVAGVVSTDPAYLMNKNLEGDHVVAIALQGRVPVKVTGVVRKGDMLVTSNIKGYAIASSDPTMGTVIGKAISEKTDPGKGTVEVLVGRA